ncbi:hypothetical protein DEM27_33395, partial [Metarhizobium album]
MNSTDLENMIRTMNASERDAIEVAAQSVLDAVKAVGAISIMPSPSMPLTGVLMHIHPKVYDRLQKMKLEADPTPPRP